MTLLYPKELFQFLYINSQKWSPYKTMCLCINRTRSQTIHLYHSLLSTTCGRI